MIAHNLSKRKLPVLFAGHGSPMNAVENNSFTDAWFELGKTLPKPKAILCISAHWQSDGSFVHVGARPRTIHDFGGFPPELYAIEYPCAGAPEKARELISMVKTIKVMPDEEWGLDHGAWSVLCRMYPQADVPVFQLSMDFSQPGEFHYALGRELRILREKDVLVVCSGNIVHNLSLLNFDETAPAYDWAEEFDEKVAGLIRKRSFAALADYKSLGSAARLAVPTPEHYLPLLYALGLSADDDSISFPVAGMSLGSLSMRAVLFGDV